MFGVGRVSFLFFSNELSVSQIEFFYEAVAFVWEQMDDYGNLFVYVLFLFLFFANIGVHLRLMWRFC